MRSAPRITGPVAPAAGDSVQPARSGKPNDNDYCVTMAEQKRRQPRQPDEADERLFNETLKRMLKTPPQPHEVSKPGVRKSRVKGKPGGRPVKKDHPEAGG